MLAEAFTYTTPRTEEIIRLLPELILSAAGTFMMVLIPLAKDRYPSLFGNFSIVAILSAIAASLFAFTNPGTAFSDLMVVDGFATFFRVLVLSVGITTVLSSYRFLHREGTDPGEFHALILFSLAGQCLMVSANSLIMIFIGLEISSIATYILCGYLRDDKRANESALKYFLLGSFATAFFLYGIAIVYGATGSVALTDIRRVLISAASPPVAMIGIAIALMLVGILFKISAAPFQVWAPDVYQGAPTPVTSFMSAGPKAAAFAIFLRIFMTAFQSDAHGWAPLVWLSALLSMTIGNFGALLQNNIKRIMAYSSIAHAGYVLVALAACSEIGTAAAMFYLAAYACMNIGMFAVVVHLSGKGERHLSIEDFAGLGVTQPVTAALLTVLILSLIGVPLTGGFFGKFYIFKAALQSNLVWLTVLGLLNSAVASYYYLRILVMMYMREPGEVTSNIEPLPFTLQAALFLPVLGTFILGVFPGALINFANHSAALK
ncbi:MAG: proton-translocating NADH-quinone oxidoreductase, chain [Bryobacterales bacterium]|nr:proton-translocating NADH-quinone oxidoreductase, chain [Bryobacterales bacterium]